ncbi:MAG: hypothetical protein LBE09_01395 [Christensenellaceae bacterium]|jgi:hypothetical protein|nr:hypothetical protein [Christensenellaceae bacterium]
MIESKKAIFSNEKPLVFSTVLAEQIGLKNAIVLSQVFNLCASSQRCIESSRCVSASPKWWHEQLLFLNERALRDVLKFLVNQNYITKVTEFDETYFIFTELNKHKLSGIDSTRTLDFLPSCAATIGLHESIIVQRIHHELESKSNEVCSNYFRASFDTWQSLLPFLSKTTLMQVAKNLVAKGVVKRKEEYAFADRTSWWTIDYGALRMYIEYFRRTTKEIADRMAAEKAIQQQMKQVTALLKNDAREWEWESEDP